MLRRPRLAVILLAAGLSRRMGRADKLLLSYAGVPLYERALRLVTELEPQETIVVTNTPVIREAARQHGFAAVPNPAAAQGIASSIACGVQALTQEADQLLFLNADQPLLRAAVVRRLLAEGTAYDAIIVPRQAGLPRSPCLFPARFRAELAALQGDRGGRQVYARHSTETRFLEFTDPEDFLDLDTQADFTALEQQRRTK